MDGNILIIEYSEYDKQKLKHTLRHIGQFHIIEVGSVKEYFHCMDSLPPLQLIILDVHLQYRDEGLEILKNMSKFASSEVPIIAATREDSLEYRSLAVKFGVRDYILKPYNVTRLEKSIRSLLKIEKAQPYDTASVSEITLSFTDFMQKELRKARKTRSPLSVILLQHMQSGEPGQEIMNELQLRLKHVVFVIDCIFYAASGDIIIVLPCTDAMGTSIATAKIRNTLQDYFAASGSTLDQIYQLASATCPEEGDSVEKLLDSARQKISDRQLMDRIAAIPPDTLQYARKRYNQFSLWF